MTHIPAVPTLPEIPSLGELGFGGGVGTREGIVMPLSVSDRVTQVRNNMYENFLQKSTKKLQDEIQHTMKTYSVEKQQLLSQLATLRHNMADLKISDSCVHYRNSGHTTAQNQPRDGAGHPPILPPINRSGTAAVKQLSDKEVIGDDGLDCFSRSSTQITIVSENCDTPDLNGRESDAKFPEKRNPKKGKVPRDVPPLRLPQIKEEQPRPDWCSGSDSLLRKHKDHSLLTALPQINEMKAISETNYDIPVVNDPVRCEISIPTKPSTKKVHFAGSNSVREANYETKLNTYSNGTSLPQIPKKKFQMTKPSKKNNRNKHNLPSITESNHLARKPEDILAQGSEGTENWKSVYVNIHDPEQRTKTLGDILYAVRVRMRENEQNLMYGHHHSDDKKDSTLCDYLLVHKDGKDGIRRTRKKPNNKRSHVPNHTAERLHRRSNAVQLQNYLRKLSRQRRMIEHMEGEEYRLTHIVGNPNLQEAAQKSVR